MYACLHAHLVYGVQERPCKHGITEQLGQPNISVTTTDKN